ncbi:phosphonate C-P lyase system protein PhnL [Roseobacter sp. S98]|uniref:phosphonate C-P lyase system protein PhnL n=1 Tax=Roseobacter algicola (ex Choi et al. 2025) (nom. illeg.) TaxID=3092138 RepID=UPI0035C76C83
MIELQNVSKTLVLHTQGAAEIPVLKGVSLRVSPGECVALTGESGTGKSTLMRMIYGNCIAGSGQIIVGDTDITAAQPRDIFRTRRKVLGCFSQFLRVVPRVAAHDVVAVPLLMTGIDPAEVRDRATKLLERLNIPTALMDLSPTTFSGGEQKRVNIARGFVRAYPAMLLDKPTASLDPVNRDIVLSLIEDAMERSAAIIGIFYDKTARNRVSTRAIDVTEFTLGGSQ